MPDPGSEFPHPVSRIQIRIKERKYFLTQKIFLSSMKILDVHPRSRIRILIFSYTGFGSWDPGVKKASDPGSGSATLATCCTVDVVGHNWSFVVDFATPSIVAIAVASRSLTSVVSAASRLRQPPAHHGLTELLAFPLSCPCSLRGPLRATSG
jgi:hypothetical protein